VIRPGERAVEYPSLGDASVVYIGRIHTPWRYRDDCPRQGKLDGPVCRIEIFEPWVGALTGIEAFSQLQVLYWLDRSRRDLVLQRPRRSEKSLGTFALRSPVRPNPIGLSLVDLVAVEGSSLLVRGLDCVDGTPLIDLKPDHCHHTPSSRPADAGNETGQG